MVCLLSGKLYNSRMDSELNGEENRDGMKTEPIIKLKRKREAEKGTERQ